MEKLLISEDEIEALYESNLIEGEDSAIALMDAIDAWLFAHNFHGDWSVRFVLKLHFVLMRRINSDIAGKLRNYDVWIGGNRKVFVSEELLRDELTSWIKTCDLENLVGLSDKAKWKKIRAWHIKFEEFHGFVDGNGRLGRLLMNIQLLNAGLPIFIIHSGREQYAYYDMFRTLKY